MTEPQLAGQGRSENSDNAHWIGGGKAPQAPLMRREFELPAEVESASIRICGLGYYELRLNGSKVGDHVLDPIVTQYDKHVRAVSYDVTEQVQTGANAMGVILGNGWYNSTTPDAWNFEHAPWRSSPKLILWFDAITKDGSRIQMVSDCNWKVCCDSPIQFNALRNGETYDARLEKAGWDQPGFDDAEWKLARIVPGPGGLITEQTSPPCKVMETLTPISVKSIRPGVAVFDLGVNIAGWAQLSIKGEAGQEIILRYSDRLRDDGEIEQKDISKHIHGGDFQTDRYICKGDGDEVWEPRFTYHGFSYVQVEGLTSEPTLDMIRGRVVHTSFESTGTFECSSNDLNQLQKITRRSFIGNFVAIPTDCPHREKNGWTGDAQLAAETGLINYNVASSYSQWLDTMADTQRPSGQFPGIVPSAGWGYNWGSGPAWDNAFILIPWYVYEHTGDLSLIERHFDSMRLYMDFCASMATDHILSFGLGDWCAFNAKASHVLTSTGYYYTDACILAKCAELIGRPHEARGFEQLATKIKSSFNEHFYKCDGIYGNGEMTSLGCALYQGLVEDSEKPSVVAALAKAVRDNDYKADFGILGAKYVPRALADNGEIETAFKLISQDAFPGWIHWLRQGSSTLWESWGGDESLNHIMFGDVSAWMFNYLAGIRPDEANPGFSYVKVQPHTVKDLDWVKATHNAPCGTIRSSWQKTGGRVEFTIELPKGIAGELLLPDGSKRPLKSGRQTISHESHQEL